METKTIDGLQIYNAERENAEVNRSEIGGVFWEESEARMVASFLLGGEVKQKELDEETFSGLAAMVSESIEPSKLEAIMARAKEVIAEDKVEDSEKVGDLKEEYEWTTKQTVRSVLSQIERSLRSVGLWSNQDYRRRAVSAAIRPTKTSFGLETNAQGFRHKTKIPLISEMAGVLELVPGNTEDGLLPHGEGGPRVISRILTPEFNEDKPMKVGRFVRGLAHEAAHEIRVWANQSLWERTGVDLAGKLLKRTNVAAYGYQVGSTLVGAEAVGMLSGLIAEKMITSDGRVPTLAEIRPVVAKKLTKRVGGETKDRYDVAIVGLFDHIDQLIKNDCGDKSAIDLLALGSCGYVTFEKLPLLLSTGVIDHETLAKMKIVLTEVFNILVK